MPVTPIADRTNPTNHLIFWDMSSEHVGVKIREWVRYSLGSYPRQAKIRESNLRNRSDIDLNEIARRFNPILQGWMNDYGKYNRSSMEAVWVQRFTHRFARGWRESSAGLLTKKFLKAPETVNMQGVFSSAGIADL